MKLDKKRIVVVGLILCLFLALYFCVYPAFTIFQKGMEGYGTSVAYHNDYKLHTTPLPENVVIDICLNLGVDKVSENCKSGFTVYAPDLFDEIKGYFNSLPEQDRTYNNVQDKLGKYLAYCENPYPDRSYRCQYDIRGDGVYFIVFFFDKKAHYHQIMSNEGGS